MHSQEQHGLPVIDARSSACGHAKQTHEIAAGIELWPSAEETSEFGK
jgi:hypothetical protein